MTARPQRAAGKHAGTRRQAHEGAMARQQRPAAHLDLELLLLYTGQGVLEQDIPRHCCEAGFQRLFRLVDVTWRDV